MRTLLTCCLLLASLPLARAQDPVEVADLTLRIRPKGEENLYYAFAPGDDILFSFTEADNKPVKEVEIIEWPDVSKFRDFESRQVEEKRLRVNRKAIYRFRFANAALLGDRVVHVHIRRQSNNPLLLRFNTGVRWVERFDTIYPNDARNKVVRFDTVMKEQKRQVLARVDTSIVTLVDRTERVHSSANLSADNKSWINFDLPARRETADAVTETVSWAYTVAVGSSGASWFQDANRRAAARGIATTLVKTGLVSTGYGAIAVLAIEGVALFSNPPDGDNVIFAFNREQNGRYQTLTHGNSVAAFGRQTEPTEGRISLQLENDNYIDAINVDVKVVAVTLTRRYRTETSMVPEVVPVTERDLTKPVIKKVVVPAFVE